MNSAGVTPQSVHQQWQFGVEIQGFNAAYFTSVDPLPNINFEEVTFAPAGSMFDQKVAGRASFPDITLSKGIPQDNPETDILDWIKKCINVYQATGGVPKDYMRDVDIVDYDRTGREIRRYRLYGAWVKEYNPGSRDGGSSENSIEEMVLTYQYFDIV